MHLSCSFPLILHYIKFLLFSIFFIDLKIFLQMIKDLFPLSCDKQLALNRVLNIDFQFNKYLCTKPNVILFFTIKQLQ